MYTRELNIQILIALLKKNEIKKIIISPGMTNISFVMCVQNDPFFETISVVDERSAAYVATGLSVESNEIVVINCTGATASRNYYPALTEAFYRNIPILVITSSQPSSRIGHYIPQVTDRREALPDSVKYNTELPLIRCDEDYWHCVIEANKAIDELTRHGGGPVHINLITDYSLDFSVKLLPDVRKITRVSYIDVFPKIEAPNVAIYVGAHIKWTDSLTACVDKFCEEYNGVVLCDSTSNYEGMYGVWGYIVSNQVQTKYDCVKPKLLIHIGNVSGAYMAVEPEEVWRVHPDGEIRDTFRKLSMVFEMDEEYFFRKYIGKSATNNTMYCSEWKNAYDELMDKVDEIPFSNVWVAYRSRQFIPEKSVVHIGILNSLRCWNYFGLPNSLNGYSNVGGFGIDGCLSSTVGASLANKQKLYYCFLGDLAFFYDVNILGNRTIGGNIRIIVNNNGEGFEFKHYASLPVLAGLDDKTDEYVAAYGHYRNENKSVIGLLAEAFGFEYYMIKEKQQFDDLIPIIFADKIGARPLLVEVITTIEKENEAQKALNNLEKTTIGMTKDKIKEVLGNQIVAQVKNSVRRITE